MSQPPIFRPHWRVALATLGASVTMVACGTTTTIDDTRSDGRADTEALVVPVVPEEGCPEVEPDLTTVEGAKLDEAGLRSIWKVCR